MTMYNNGLRRDVNNSVLRCDVQTLRKSHTQTLNLMIQECTECKQQEHPFLIQNFQFRKNLSQRIQIESLLLRHR